MIIKRYRAAIANGLGSPRGVPELVVPLVLLAIACAVLWTAFGLFGRGATLVALAVYGWLRLCEAVRSVGVHNTMHFRDCTVYRQSQDAAERD